MNPFIVKDYKRHMITKIKRMEVETEADNRFQQNFGRCKTDS